MTDFDYKKYSLENLENWLHDALSCEEASSHEIYSVIRKVVQDQYNYHREQMQRSFGLLELLSGHRPINFNDLVSEDSFLKQDRNSNFPKENTVCDRDDSSPECKKSWTKFWEDVPVPLYVSEDGDVWAPDTVVKNDKVVKWQLPVSVDGLTGDCYVNFPDDLLEAANLKEGDVVKWVDNKDGSYTLTKV